MGSARGHLGQVIFVSARSRTPGSTRSSPSLQQMRTRAREDIRLPGIHGSTKRDYPAAAPSWPPTPSPGHRIQLADGPTASKHVAAGAHIKLFSSKSQVLILGADFVDLERAAQQVESRGAQCALSYSGSQQSQPRQEHQSRCRGATLRAPAPDVCSTVPESSDTARYPDSPVPVVHRPQSHDPFVLSRGFARRLRENIGSVVSPQGVRHYEPHKSPISGGLPHPGRRSSPSTVPVTAAERVIRFSGN